MRLTLGEREARLLREALVELMGRWEVQDEPVSSDEQKRWARLMEKLRD